MSKYVDVSDKILYKSLLLYVIWKNKNIELRIYLLYNSNFAWYEVKWLASW